MSRIDDLIRELCPEGVQHRTIGDVVTHLRTGLNPRSNFRLNQDDAVGWYVTVRELDGFDIRYQDKTDRLDGEGIRRIQQRSQLSVGDVLFSGTGTIGRTALVAAEPIDWNIKEGVYALTPDSTRINSRFLIYLLNSREVAARIESKSAGSTVKSIPFRALKGVELPVPPIRLQEEIVRILDTFTELEAALEAELEARTTQYEETRNRLMDFESVEGNPLAGLIRELCPEGVPLATLGSLGQFFRGGSFKKDQLTIEGHPAIHYGEIYTKYRASFADVFSFVSNDVFQAQPKAIYGDLLFTVSDVTPNNVGTATTWVGDGEIALGGDILAFRHGLNPRYLSYFVKTDFFQAQKRLVVTGGTVRHISAKGLSKIRVYVPPLRVQEEVVRILDSFDSLVNDLSVGLPAEIAARRKQYEYYRDKLLSFEGLAA